MGVGATGSKGPKQKKDSPWRHPGSLSPSVMERTLNFYLTEAPASVGIFTDMLFASVVLCEGKTMCFYCVFVMVVLRQSYSVVHTGLKLM